MGVHAEDLVEQQMFGKISRRTMERCDVCSGNFFKHELGKIRGFSICSYCIKNYIKRKSNMGEYEYEPSPFIRCKKCGKKVLENEVNDSTLLCERCERRKDMPVKKVRAPATRKKKTTAKKTRRKKPSGKALGLELPDNPKPKESDFHLYSSLFYGRAGVGKSSMLASFPDALMFSCERVSKGIECHDFNWENGGVNCWEVMLEGVKLLEETDRFKTVCIDTIDAAYAHCLDYICRKLGIEHPQDEGYGKGWKAVKDEFSATMDRIWATGRGIAFSSHSKEVEITSHSGSKYTRIQPTMSGQAYQYIKQKTDFVFYCEFVKDINGRSRRIMFTTGDEIVDAKHAEIFKDFPMFLPMDKNLGSEIIVKAFAGDKVGIPIDEIRPSKETSKSGGAILDKQRLKNARKGGKKKTSLRRK